MKKILLFGLLVLMLSACNGPLDQPSDGELEELIAETIEDEMQPLGFLNLFSSKNKKEKSKLIEFEKIENLKRADWKDNKQKFKADVTLSFLSGMNLPDFTLNGDIDVNGKEIEIEEKDGGHEMEIEVQGYLYKDEFDEWVVEFVD